MSGKYNMQLINRILQGSALTDLTWSYIVPSRFIRCSFLKSTVVEFLQLAYICQSYHNKVAPFSLTLDLLLSLHCRASTLDKSFTQTCPASLKLRKYGTIESW